MKKLVLLLLATVALVTAGHAQISLNVNIGTQPLWGPAGYQHAEYYYLPDIETYYYVPKREFIYLSNGKWMFTPALPARHRSYNLYEGYKVVLNVPKPYFSFTDHKVKYAKFKNYRGKQATLKSKGTGNSRAKITAGTKTYSGKSSKAGMGRSSTGKAEKSKGQGNSDGNGNGKGGGHGAGKGGGKH